MAELKETNWADDDSYDSDEADGEFGLDAINSASKQRSPDSKVSSFVSIRF